MVIKFGSKFRWLGYNNPTSGLYINWFSGWGLVVHKVEKTSDSDTTKTVYYNLFFQKYAKRVYKIKRRWREIIS